VQLCGWLGTHELYPGAMPDSRYLNETGIFQEQEAFMTEDGGDALINEVNLGFRSCLAAWKPNFMNSDGKFTTGEVLRSASIAADLRKRACGPCGKDVGICEARNNRVLVTMK